MRDYLFIGLIFFVFTSFGIHLLTSEPRTATTRTPYMLQPDEADLLEERITLGDSMFEELHK